MGETRVFEVYDPTTGDKMGGAPNRYQAAKLARELDCKIRRIWVRSIITNNPEQFANCPKR